MTYLIRYIKNNETIATEDSDEHPDEDHLRSQVKLLGADYADVSRKED